jgi:RTX calcium-binding nonapeptide repeat (4 copies)/Lipase (class 3)
VGLGGSDTLTGSAGDDTMYGGALGRLDPVSDLDIAIYPGSADQYAIERVTGLASATKIIAMPGSPTTGSDTLYGVEWAKFAEFPRNNVVISRGQPLVELVQLAVDAYDDTTVHETTRIWRPLTYIELGMRSAGSGPATANGIQFDYEFLGPGSYQASDNRLVAPAVANAHVLAGTIDGKKTLAVSFRGTSDIGDWVDNLLFFRNHYNKFGPLIEAIDRYVDAYNVEQVFVTGHSLGGAMVQLFMQDHPGLKYIAATIGAPGVHDAIGGADQRTLHLEHTQDLVTAAEAPLLLKFNSQWTLPSKFRTAVAPTALVLRNTRNFYI